MSSNFVYSLNNQMQHRGDQSAGTSPKVSATFSGLSVSWRLLDYIENIKSQAPLKKHIEHKRHKQQLLHAWFALI